MKSFEQVKTNATEIIENIENKFQISIEVDDAVPAYYESTRENFFDMLKVAYCDYINIIEAIGTDDNIIDDMISLEVVELDEEDSVIETHYLDTFSL